MTCDDFQGRYLSGDVDEETSKHVNGCTWCTSRLFDLDALSGMLAERETWEVPSAELEASVIDGISGTTSIAARSLRSPIIWAAVASFLVVVVGTAAVWQSRRPDWDIALPATGGVTATASVAGWNTEAGTRMVFDIDGLAPAGENEFYEIWLTADDGRHVSAGTFIASGRIESFAGVSRRDFPRIWITLEPNDGDEGINGVTVLDTKV